MKVFSKVKDFVTDNSLKVKNGLIALGTGSVATCLMALPCSAAEGATTDLTNIITADTFAPVVTVFVGAVGAVIGIVVGFVGFRKAWGFAKSQIAKG